MLIVLRVDEQLRPVAPSWTSASTAAFARSRERAARRPRRPHRRARRRAARDVGGSVSADHGGGSPRRHASGRGMNCCPPGAEPFRRVGSRQALAGDEGVQPVSTSCCSTAGSPPSSASTAPCRESPRPRSHSSHARQQLREVGRRDVEGAHEREATDGASSASTSSTTRTPERGAPGGARRTGERPRRRPTTVVGVRGRRGELADLRASEERGGAHLDGDVGDAATVGDHRGGHVACQPLDVRRDEPGRRRRS
jgi:hypothetical protein